MSASLRQVGAALDGLPDPVLRLIFDAVPGFSQVSERDHQLAVWYVAEALRHYTRAPTLKPLSEQVA